MDGFEALFAVVIICINHNEWDFDCFPRRKLEGLTKEEGKTYILEKLKGAGCNQTVFEDAAIEAILNAADGTPRLINKYCNASMLIGDNGRANLITIDIVMQAINDCELG